MEIWRQQYLGLETVPPPLTNAEIEFFFAPSDEAWSIIARRRTSMTRFGLILHVGFLKMTGRSLSAIDLIPVPVLACAARYADIPPLQIATLRAIYRPPKTLFAHQKIAAVAVGLKPFGDPVSRHVTAFLRRQAGSVISRDELVRDAMLWLYDHGYMLLRQRMLERLAAEAQTHALTQLKAAITKQMHPIKTSSWASELGVSVPHLPKVAVGMSSTMRLEAMLRCI